MSITPFSSQFSYKEVSPLVVMGALDEYIDDFISKYATHIVFLGRMWRVWRNGEWVVGNDAEVSTYLHKYLLEKERSSLSSEERAVVMALRDPEYRDLFLSILKREPGIQASEFEAALRTGEANRAGGWRKYQKWAAQLSPPPGESRRVGPDPDVVEAALLEEYSDLGIVSFQFDERVNLKNIMGYEMASQDEWMGMGGDAGVARSVGMHVDKVEVPLVRWNIGPLSTK